MIINVDDNGTHWASETQSHLIDSILIAKEDVFDKVRLEMFIVDCKVNLLLSKSVLATQVAGLLDLELCNASVGSELYNWLKDVDSTC